MHHGSVLAAPFDARALDRSQYFDAIHRRRGDIIRTALDLTTTTDNAKYGQ